MDLSKAFHCLNDEPLITKPEAYSFIRAALSTDPDVCEYGEQFIFCVVYQRKHQAQSDIRISLFTCFH